MKKPNNLGFLNGSRQPWYVREYVREYVSRAVVHNLFRLGLRGH